MNAGCKFARLMSRLVCLGFRGINSFAEISRVHHRAYSPLAGLSSKQSYRWNVLLIPHVVVAVLPQNVLDTRHRVIHYLGNQESVICLFSWSGGASARVPREFATFTLA